MQIREYRQQDLAAIRMMAEQIVEDGTVFPFENTQGVTDYWFSKNAKTYIAEFDSQVVGSFVIKPNLPDRCSHIANAGYMVDERNRDQGIGKQMAAQSLILAKELGFKAMQFNIVVATNLAAIHVWKSLGFQEIGQVPEAFRHPERGMVNALIMYKKL